MFQVLNSKFQDKNGFTLIEGIVSVAVFSIIFLALFALFGTVLSTIRNNKAKVTANSIALEQLEIIRGMKFDDVATDTGWVPVGPIPSKKDINRGAFNFTVEVDVAFFDDPFDGTSETSPEDLFPFDYKKARVKVIWINPVTKGQETVVMSTNIVPPGLEGGTGIMVVSMDADGAPVSNAIVNITSSVLGSPIDALTDLNGNLWVGGLEVSDDYHIVVTKDGYNTDQTYPADNSDPKDLSNPNYNPNPTKLDAAVAEGEVTRVAFSIDLLGSLEINTVNYNNPQNWQVNTDSGSDNQTKAALAIDSSDNAYFVWVSNEEGTGKVYIQKYDLSSGLVQWVSGDVEIADSSDQSGKIVPRITMALDENYFYVAWNDNQAIYQNVYLQKFNSSDGSPVPVSSPAWGGIVEVSVNSGDETDQAMPDLAIDVLGNIYLTWMDNRNGNWDIYAQKYDSGGANPWIADLKVNSDIDSNRRNPRIVIDNDNNFYIVWDDEINGVSNKDIFLAKFDENGGIGFAGKKVNTDISILDQYEPSIAYDGADHLYLCWSDRRSSEPDIYAGKYNRAGMRINDEKWASGDVKINDDSTFNAWRTESAIAYSNDGEDEAIYFSWKDSRNGNYDIYSAKIDSNGNKIWENKYDLIMNGDDSIFTQAKPQIAVDSAGYAITVWEDFRNEGDYNIYAARYEDLIIVPAPDIPITITGLTKLKGTYPKNCEDDACLPIYKYNNEDLVSDANGVINIGDGVNELEWDDYSFAPRGGYTIVSTDQAIPLSICPGDNELIVINVES